MRSRIPLLCGLACAALMARPAFAATCLVPEIGDEVLVAFLPGETSPPSAVGAVWRGAERPSDRGVPVPSPAAFAAALIATRSAPDAASRLALLLERVGLGLDAAWSRVAALEPQLARSEESLAEAVEALHLYELLYAEASASLERLRRGRAADDELLETAAALTGLEIALRERPCADR